MPENTNNRDDLVAAKIDMVIIKLSVLDIDQEKTYARLVALERATEKTHEKLLDTLQKQNQRAEQVVSVIQKVSNEVLVVRRAVEPGKVTRLGIMFAGSLAGGVLVNLFFKVLGLDLSAKILAVSGDFLSLLS